MFHGDEGISVQNHAAVNSAFMTPMTFRDEASWAELLWRL